MPVIICPNCQKEINDQAKFCNFCRFKIKSEQKIASSNRRLINCLLDMGFAYVFAFLFGLVLGISGIYSILGMEKWDTTVLSYFAYFAYFLATEMMFQRTIAKFITKTKVVTETGFKPTQLQILGRTLCRFIPFDVFSFSGKNPIGWHDKFSHTLVIQE